MNKRIIMPVAVAFLVAGVVLTTSHVYAQTPGSASDNQNFFSKFFQMIGKDLGLDKNSSAPAQAMQMKGNHKGQPRANVTPPTAEELQQREDQRLSKLVTNGKITEAQKQLILAKMKELFTARLNMRQNAQNMTKDQRKAEMDKEKADLEAWAKANNIDMKYLMMGPGRRFEKDGMKNHEPSPSPTK